MRRWRRTEGQASGEYVALVALVAVALALVAGLASGGVGGAVLAGVQRGLCRVTGAACPRPRPPADELAPCPLERTTRGESLDGAYELVRLGRNGTLTAVRGSDGRVTVTLADATSAGGEVGLGLELGVGRLRGAEATAGVRLSVASGRSWTLPSAAAARAFLARFGSKATIGGQAVDLVRSGCSLLCDAIGWRPHAELPPPDELVMDHGVAARFEAAIGPAKRAVSGGGLLGARLGRDGSSTWFLQLDAAAAAQIADGPATAGADAQGQAVVSYTLDAHRRPLRLVVHTAARATAAVGLAGSRSRLKGSLGARGGLVVERDATLDLHDPANRATAAAFVAALRRPRAPGALWRSAAAVRARIARAGVLDRRVYALTSSAFELGAKAAVGLQFGGTFGRTRQRMRLLRAETRLPGLPYLPRDDCRVA